jgi:hypothetical protein
MTGGWVLKEISKEIQGRLDINSMPVIPFGAIALTFCTPEKASRTVMQEWLTILCPIGLIAEAIFHPAHIVELLNWAVSLIP